MINEDFGKNEQGKQGYNRDGFGPRNENRGERSGRSPRPRINRAQSVGYNAQDEGGFSPRPRPRFNSPQGEGGFRPRFQRSDYQRRGGSEGGYQQQGGGFRRQEGGYQRQGGGFGRQGGGFNRDDQQRRGGYRPDRKYSQKKRYEYKEENIDPDAPIRLNKYLANAGICSRRDADRYIEAGVVSVNGQVVTELGTKVLRSDNVVFHDDPVRPEKKVYVLLNKPKGYVTTSDDPQNRRTVMDLVRGACRERIYPIGRLDRNTTGVLLLTNDGELASKLTHPQYRKKKIYHVYLDHNLAVADMHRIAEGITLEDGDIKADDIQYVSDSDRSQVGIEIHSGRNRIVRRIFESLGYHVTKLDRVYFAGLTKKNVKRGDWRYLTPDEVNYLRMGAFE
ncbi:MAG: pseudouridine synthase [Alloprevotella sp.]|nr:pseudouridine synthase [Alloprevotella sp.]